MRRILTRRFFRRSALRVARDLLGKYLVCRIGGREVARMIIEVEIYSGIRDRASHASRGKTPRNRVMFGEGGRWYVYFVYGMHWMLNVVTGCRGYPAAILIRGVEGIPGPARVTKHFRISRRFNRKMIARGSGLWVEDRGMHVPARAVRRSPRVGVDYAGEVWKSKLWRFFVLPKTT